MNRGISAPASSKRSARSGPSMMPILLEHARAHADDTAMTIDILGVVGGTAAIDSLLEWSGSPDAAVRAAALRAIGSIGLDDRSYFYALRGLEDEDTDVRSMAARGLGRSGRHAAVPYLAAHLDDAWLVAAHCASGLRRLGRGGRGRAPGARRDARPGRRSRPADAVGTDLPEGGSLTVLNHWLTLWFTVVGEALLAYLLILNSLYLAVRDHLVLRAPASPPALDRPRPGRDRALAGDAADLADRAGLQRSGDDRREPARAAAPELPGVRSGRRQRRLDRRHPAGGDRGVRPGPRRRGQRTDSRDPAGPRRLPLADRTASC